MVYGVLLHTLRSSPPRILFSRHFGTDVPKTSNENPFDVKQEDDNDVLDMVTVTNSDPRIQRKDYFLSIAERVQSEYSFKTTVTPRSYETEAQILATEGTLPDFEIGFFKFLPADEEGGHPGRIVIWMGALNCAMTLVCYPAENRLAAELTLKELVKYTQQHCQVWGQAIEAVLKADRVTLIVNQFLPNGQLLISNHRLIRQLEKELEAKMKSLN